MPASLKVRTASTWLAAAMLIDAMGGEPAPPRLRILSCDLQVGGSTGRPG